jgi:CheY-specific phosphatase CheX
MPQHLQTSAVGQDLTNRYRDTWNGLLGLDLQPDPSDAPEVQDSGPRWSAWISLAGEWRGITAISFDAELARMATAAMLGIDASEVTVDDIRDAVGELVNQLAGQTKMALGQGSSLGLPLVIEGGQYESIVPKSYTVATLRFHCEGHPVELRVASADRRAVPRR